MGHEESREVAYLRLACRLGRHGPPPAPEGRRGAAAGRRPRALCTAATVTTSACPQPAFRVPSRIRTDSAHWGPRAGTLGYLLKAVRPWVSPLRGRQLVKPTDGRRH